MTYKVAITALRPDHFWTWDGVHDDFGVGPSAPRPSNQDGGNTATIGGAPICKDSTSSLLVGTVSQRTECADSPQINSQSQPVRTMGGWFRASNFERSPSSIYKEGGGGNNIALLIGFGNNVLVQVVNGNNFDIQCYSDFSLIPGRAYHLAFQFAGDNDGNFFKLFIDGVEQIRTDPAPPSPNTPEMPGHGSDINWGAPDIALNVGGTRRGFNGARGDYSHWASWTEILSGEVLRVDLFERGALPTHVVASQADLDALSGQLLPDSPLSILVDVPGDIDLVADGITFDPRASIHVQYNGDGICNWTNVNGSNASITSAIGGGSVVVSNPATLTLTGMHPGSDVVIKNPNILASGDGANVVATFADIAGTSVSFDTSGAPAIVDVEVYAVGFKMAAVRSVELTGVDASIPISQSPDPAIGP